MGVLTHTKFSKPCTEWNSRIFMSTTFKRSALKKFGMSNFKDFDEYISSLKVESERGAVPNNEVPLERFIQVARNILKKIEDLKPVQGNVW